MWQPLYFQQVTREARLAIAASELLLFPATHSIQPRGLNVALYRPRSDYSSLRLSRNCRRLSADVLGQGLRRGPKTQQDFRLQEHGPGVAALRDLPDLVCAQFVRFPTPHFV